MLTPLYLLPLSACKRVLDEDSKKPGRDKLTTREKEILTAVQDHLFPEEAGTPGSKKLNSLHHFELVLTDRHLSNWKKKLLISSAALLLLGVVIALLKLLFVDFVVDFWWFQSQDLTVYFLMRSAYRYLVFAFFTAVFFGIFFFNL